MRGCKCGKCSTCWMRAWVQRNREEYNAKRRGNPRVQAINNRANKKAREIARAEAIAEYGGRCECCGETEERFLSIDHVNGNGAEHRATDKSASNMFLWVKRHGFPKDGYRLLCMNCNWATRYGDICPHKMQVAINV